MNALTATLCQKPAIGVAMWLMTLCVTNQAFHEKYINLNNTGMLLTETFDAPMDEQYNLMLLLPSDDKDKQNWSNLLCAIKPIGSVPLSSLSIAARVTNLTMQSTTTHMFPIACPRPKYENGQALMLGSMQLQSGKYRVELINDIAVQSPNAKRVQVLLRGEGAGFP